MHSEQGEYATASRRDSDSKSPSRRRRAGPAWMSATSNAIADPHAGMIECDGQFPDMAARERLAEGRSAEDLFLERQRVGGGKRVAGRGELGGGRSIKKKKKKKTSKRK